MIVDVPATMIVAQSVGIVNPAALGSDVEKGVPSVTATDPTPSQMLLCSVYSFFGIIWAGAVEAVCLHISFS